MDPYCGSGTTLLEAAMDNAEVYGFDCNPIAKLISECKLINLTKEQVITILDNFREPDLIEVNQSSEMYSLHNFEGRDHWFSQNAQREFGLLLKIINKFDRDSKEWILLATTLSAITNTFSNQDSETRYAAIEKSHKPNDILKAFVRKLSKNLDAIEERGELSSNSYQITLGDIRNGLEVPDGVIDMVITSPPYANTMDYYLYHKQRMNLLGFDFKSTQKKEIGSRHEYSSKKVPAEQWDTDYLLGMTQIMKAIKNGGKAIFVIGDSRINGEHVNGGELTLRSAKKLGLEAKILESVSMTGKSRTFRSSFQAANKYEHVVEILK